jgi:ubiquinone/menaquinone biosynthesis C-methylase UbiE
MNYGMGSFYGKSLTPLQRKIETKLYNLKARYLTGFTLDIGCGNGEFLEMHKNSIGVDAHPLSISVCRSKGLNVIRGDCHKLMFKDGKFDSVHCNSVLSHCEYPFEVIKEIRRVLKPGGILYLADNDISTRKWSFYDDYTHKTALTTKSLLYMLNDNNFEIVKVSWIPYIPRFFGRIGHLPLPLFTSFTKICGVLKKRQVEIIARKTLDDEMKK